MKNTFGSDLSLTIFGESHGRAVGAVLDGMAAGVPLEEAFLRPACDGASVVPGRRPFHPPLWRGMRCSFCPAWSTAAPPALPLP